MKVLLTGAAGFIGYHTAKMLLDRGDSVVGVDNFDEFYDARIKRMRSDQLGNFERFKIANSDISDFESLNEIVEGEQPDKICNLAAMAGVFHSLKDPFSYIDTNVKGFVSVLEAARRNGVEHVVYASSASVYGANKKVPFSEDQRVDTPVSLYAATKRGNEGYAYQYHDNFGIQSTGLRFFSVYGPWGRPDNVLWLFAKNMLSAKPIDVYNRGDMYRDFTFVTDIADGIVRSLDRPMGCEVINLGRGDVVKLNYLIECLEDQLGTKAIRNDLPFQAGDIHKSYADVSKAKEVLGFQAQVSMREGVKRFCDWFVPWYEEYCRLD